ncbi:hypothetical protein H6F87_24840 [Cyanobacteria bacterium FACHB-502]|nr:hypothetical protein [Cyanobacteria bacterium FACHB-502]
MERYPKHLLDVYELYLEYLKATHSEQRAANFTREIWYTFTSCLLIGLGYDHIPSGTKLTQVEIQAARAFMKTQRLGTLLDARIAQQQGFKLVERSPKMREIYQRSLDKFLAWCGQRPWWPGEKPFQYSSSSLEFCCPDLQGNYGSKAEKRLTHRRSAYVTYTLQPKEIFPNLQAELSEFYQFLTKPEHPERIGKSIKEKSADKYLSDLLLFLGWFHRFEGVPLDQLNLNLLIPTVCKEDLKKLTEKEQKKLWAKHRKHIEAWLSRYLTFLRESMQSTSPRTRGRKFSSLSALGRFQYRTAVEVSRDYRRIEVLQVIENQHKRNSQKVTTWNRNKQFVADQEQKWPDVEDGQTALSTVRQNVLESLRLECFPKSKDNKLREGSAIAKSEQQFLAWFLLAGMPPRRQEEYRDLKTALSCPIQRPSTSVLPENGVYHPLPPAEVRDQRHDGTVKDNYIYKTYFYKGRTYKNGLWVLDIQEYKMVDKYGPQSIVIKNRQFKDGTCLYDYFDHYLYGWWLPGGRKKQQLYDWWQQNLRGRRGRWVSAGRASFEPGDACYIDAITQDSFWVWGYFFVQPQVGKRINASRFEEFVETAAHHYTGKQIAPHIMRAVWATWAYQIGLTDQQKSSLAYAMGHDLRTLRELYDRSPSEEKRRLIEEVIDRLFFDEEVFNQPVPQSAELSSLEQRLRSLTKVQQQQLAEILARS